MIKRNRLQAGSGQSACEPWQAPLVHGPIAAKTDAVPARPPTASEVQAIQSVAYEEGFQLGRKEGHEQGLRQGQSEGQAQLARQCALLAQIHNQLAEPISELDDEVTRRLVELAIQVARHLVRRELRTEPGEIVAVVRQALAALPVAARHPRIYLHPEDADLVRNALSIGEDDGQWRIEEDLLMTRGDCRVETEASLVDASIEARLANILARLMGGERLADGAV